MPQTLPPLIRRTGGRGGRPERAGVAATGEPRKEEQILDRFDHAIRDSIPVVGEFILPKHLKDMGKDRETFAMSDVELLTEKVVRAVNFCAGEEKAREVRGKLRRIVSEARDGDDP